jgi:hypothetical protein
MTARLWVFCPTMASEIGGQTITALMDRQYRKRGAAGPRLGPRAQSKAAITLTCPNYQARFGVEQL